MTSRDLGAEEKGSCRSCCWGRVVGPMFGWVQQKDDGDTGVTKVKKGPKQCTGFTDGCRVTLVFRKF